MKKLLIPILVFALISGCKKPGCMDPTALNYNQYATTDDGTCDYPTIPNLVTGTITEDLTLTNDKIWNLSGRVSVTNGATLTIEPGTIIKGQPGTGANATCLIISRQGTINAQGTPEQPIIFTSEADAIELGQISGTLPDVMNGLWGGIIICGNAPISAAVSSMQIEGIPASDQNGLYGGNDETDNRGIMSYVSIRHGGANIGEGNEINGLTLGGVGNGTTIENIEIYGNQDDGIEWFGGNVNVSNVLVVSAGDDLIDIDQGYGGSVTNCLIVPSESSDHALEIDGGEGQWNAAFTIENCTIIGIAEAHFRADATGFIELYGDCNIEADEGTAVLVTNATNPIDESIFDWTCYFNQ